MSSDSGPSSTAGSHPTATGASIITITNIPHPKAAPPAELPVRDPDEYFSPGLNMAMLVCVALFTAALGCFFLVPAITPEVVSAHPALPWLRYVIWTLTVICGTDGWNKTSFFTCFLPFLRADPAIYRRTRWIYRCVLALVYIGFLSISVVLGQCETCGWTLSVVMQAILPIISIWHLGKAGYALKASVKICLYIAYQFPSVSILLSYFVVLPLWVHSKDARPLVRIFILPLVWNFTYRWWGFVSRRLPLPTADLNLFFIYPKASDAVIGRSLVGGGESLGISLATLFFVEVVDLVIRLTYLHRRMLTARIVGAMKRKPYATREEILEQTRTHMYISLSSIEIVIEIAVGMFVTAARLAGGNDIANNVVLGVFGLVMEVAMAFVLMAVWQRQGMAVEWLAPWTYLTPRIMAFALWGILTSAVLQAGIIYFKFDMYSGNPIVTAITNDSVDRAQAN